MIACCVRPLVCSESLLMLIYVVSPSLNLLDAVYYGLASNIYMCKQAKLVVMVVLYSLGFSPLWTVGARSHGLLLFVTGLRVATCEQSGASYGWGTLCTSPVTRLSLLISSFSAPATRPACAIQKPVTLMEKPISNSASQSPATAIL